MTKFRPPGFPQRTFPLKRIRSAIQHCLIAAATASLLPTSAGATTPEVVEEATEAVTEEIIVRAELRDGSLMDVPSSVSIVRPDARRDAVAHLDEFLGRIANVNFASGSSRARYLQVRGIGETGQFAEPLNASVGMMLDGVDLSGVGSAATTYDIEQIEVFRGPQGTLYGANALAGLVNLTSAAPTGEWSGRVDAEAANKGGRSLGAAVSGPITDQLGFRLSAHRHEDDGFMSNDFLGRDDTNQRRETTVRGKLVWSSDQTDIEANAGFVDMDNRYDAFSLDNNRHTLSDQPGEDTQESVYGSLRIRHDFDDAVAVEAVVSRADSEIGYGYDEDWTFDGFHPDGYTSTDHYARDWQSQSFDLRMLSTETGTVVGWVFGLYGYSQDVDLVRTYTFLDAPYASDHSVERYALYGELEFPLSSRLRLVTGLRAESHNSKFDDSAGVSSAPGDTMIGGRVVLEYDADQALLYAAINRGYKAGGFNTSGTLDADLRTFQPEVLWNAEAGIKGDLLDDTLQLRLAAFWMERRDVQVSTSVTRVRADGSAEFIDFIGNAAEGFNRGIEADFSWVVNGVVSIDGSFGWLDTEYDEFVNGEGVQLDGRSQAHAPKYQYHAGIEFRPEGQWFARLDVEGKDSFYFSDSHDVQSDAYVLLHAAVGYETDAWTLSAWARNLTDEDVLTRGFFFGNDPRDGYTPRGFTQSGEPRRYGVSLTWRFQ